MLERTRKQVKNDSRRRSSGLSRIVCVIAAVAGILIVPSAVSAGTSELPKSLLQFAESELRQIGRDQVIVQAVRAQNAKKGSLKRIKEIDEWWKASEDVEPFMFDLMRNRCALTLENFQVHNKFVLEAFVMDNQGALVALTNKTSDYWQGDEDKFTESYMNGAGAIHYGDVEYDESTGEIQIQISVPVMDGGRAIGAITFGISLDRWERR